MLATTQATTETIARLNDRARQGLDRTARIVITANLLAQISDGTFPGDVVAQARVMKAARECTFTSSSPERDFSSFEIDGVQACLKIDYYDLCLEFGSDDPADASVTRRVITIMAREDY
ncbi:DUF3768 domain-containing protein [Novosphingobium sp. JCM 18896]|uniref:DUF3768 domain-containing protein n=1 Tax=Novosphingobium sp. JCM 18896 TaxID=2989731 RepID=UPI0022227C86|nr:DUF3768 domain-containing protein [Novosphingobium sp. JCM 18896]MCW1431999.1 DUF3768 domain-containing protein [Novosphingobium sp. JCM 18896]